MLKRLLLLVCITPLCIGASCSVIIPGDEDEGGGHLTPGYVQLDRATADIRITADMSDANADVAATIRRYAATVVLQDGQAVSINGEPLSGPSDTGAYSTTVPRDSVYVVRVVEPTLGTIETPLSAPPDFEITEPAPGAAVSLADGFTLSWSNPLPDAACQVTMSQTRAAEVTEVLEPFADDSGSVRITAEDLIQFRQGTDITVRLTRIAQALELEGFAHGTARIELSDAIRVVPGP